MWYRNGHDEVLAYDHQHRAKDPSEHREYAYKYQLHKKPRKRQDDDRYRIQLTWIRE